MRFVRSLLAGCLLGCFGLGLALGAIEAYVRVAHRVPDRFWEPDARRGTRLIAGKTGWWTQEDREFTVPIRINSAGWRDVEHTPAKAPGVVRVLLLGDSFVEAMHVPLEATLGRRLEAALNRAGDPRRFEVLSMGVSGYGTAGELLTYRDEARAYAPDIVILAFYPGNDVKNNSPTLETVLRPVYDTAGELQRVVAAEDRGAQPSGLWSRVRGAWQGYQWVRKSIVTQHPLLARRLVAAGWLGREAMREAPKRDGIPVDYGVYAKTPAPEWNDAWQRTWRLIESLRESVAAAGGRFALLLVTAREGVYPDTWREIVASNPSMRAVDWDVGGPERRVMEWCGEHALPCLQLSPAFARQSPTGPPLHFRHDGHWTEAGHALAAERMAEFLRESGMLSIVTREER